MVRNLVHNLCESLVTNIGNIADTGKRTPPTPITYLTQWQIVGNSEVHTLPYPDIPQGYTKCKYLEFHGTEYIDSGVLTKNGIGFRCQYSTTEANKSMFGAQSRNGDLFLFSLFTTNTAKIGYGGASITANINTNPIDGNQHTLILDSEQCKIDNESVKFSRRTASLFYNVFIGTHNVANNADTRMFIGKIYEFKLYDSNGNLFNGIPCLDDNNIPCLYDTVSRTAFYNIGTGTFGYEIEPQPTEIWSCGEYNATDGKYHILVQPQGGSIADIALDEPLRKVNDVADTIEFPSDTEGKALVTRPLVSIDMGNIAWKNATTKTGFTSHLGKLPYSKKASINLVSAEYEYKSGAGYNEVKGLSNISNANNINLYDPDYNTPEDATAFVNHVRGMELIYELETPTTELVDAPQIEEADSYSCVISQGGKAVEWTEFVANPT